MKSCRRVRAVDRDDVHAGEHLVEALPVGGLQLLGDAPRLVQPPSEPTRFPCPGNRFERRAPRLGSGQVASFYDPAIVRELQETGTPATFFVTGLWAMAYPAAVRLLAGDPLFEVGLGFRVLCGLGPRDVGRARVARRLLDEGNGKSDGEDERQEQAHP